MIYQPAEDSFLLAAQLKLIAKGKSVLDFGSGSGIQAETAIKAKAKSVLAIDINPESIELLKSKKIPARKSDLFSAIKKNEKFDIIVFNPPYLPIDDKEDEESQLATTGGKHGDELILNFLKQAQNHLNKKGIILLLLSSLTPRDKIEKLLKKQKLKSNTIAEEKLFFEKLSVLKINKGSNKTYKK